jgi:diguanylate cyclase (GGDEF)-like protein/PAS domain S-box-containing protein
MLYTPYSLPLILSGVVLLAIAGFALRFKSTPAVRAHVAMMLFGAAWSFVYALAISTPSLEPRVFLENCALVLSLGTSASAFIMAVDYTGHGAWLSKDKAAILFALPSLIGILALTNSWHRLFRYGFFMDYSSVFPSLESSIGVLYPLFMIYQILILSSSIVVLLFSTFRDKRVRGTAILMSAGIAVLNAVGVFFGLGSSPIRGFDTGPIVLIVAGICNIIGLSNGRSCGVTFIARDLVIESLPDLAIVLDERGRLVDLNGAARMALGISEGAARGESLPEPWASKLGPLTVGDRIEVSVTINGDRRNFEVRAEPVEGGGRRKLGELFILRDVTETRRAEECLRESEGKFRTLAETTEVGMYIYDGKSLQLVNPAFVRITGYTAADLADIDPLSLIHPEELEILRTRGISRLNGASQIEKFETRLVTREGEHRWIELSASVIAYRGRPASLGSFVDVTERKRLEESLRSNQALYLGIVEDQIDPVCRWLPDTTLTFVNEAYCEYFGLSRGETLGKRFETWIPEESRAIVRDVVDELVRGRSSTAVREELNCTCEGKRRWMAWVYRPVKVEEGRVVEIQSVGRDITALKEAEEALARANGELTEQLERNRLLQERLIEQAVRDITTGLFNRRYLEETLDREIAAAERDGSSLCVIMMDLDHFKRVNDEHGHSAGDIVLASIGSILAERTRHMDIACRYGGEEFVVIMPGATLEAALERAEELRRTVEEREIALGKAPFSPSLRITMSAGVAAFPGHGQLADALLSAADCALYKAKESGRNNVQVYGRDMKAD